MKTVGILEVGGNISLHLPLHPIYETLDPNHRAFNYPMFLVIRERWLRGRTGTMPMWITKVTKQRFELVRLPDINEASVCGTHEIVDVAGGTAFCATTPPLLVADDLYGAFQSFQGVERGVTTIVISAVDGLFDVNINVNPLRVLDDIPEWFLDL